MKAGLGSLALCISIAIASQAWANDLPDACGSDAVHFNVTTERAQPLPTPTAGHAQVVFIESVDEDFCLGCNRITTRAAIDGAWVGANKGNSYFVADVLPGEHHVCADWQRVFNMKLHVTTFTAEAGKTYFILIRVTNRKYKTGDIERKDEKVRLYQLGDSEGLRLAGDSEHSVATVYE